MPNPYLVRLREKYDGLKTGIDGLQTRATEENRDLSEDELRSITEQGEEAKKLFTQITDLTDVESRHVKVAELAASLLPDKDSETRSVGTSDTTTRDRDPGHYTRGSDNSFFRDLHLARLNSDEDAQRRLVEHNRALSTGSHGPGVVPPKWLTDEFEELSRQGRALAGAVRNIPLGDDPRPFTLPKQIAGVDNTVVTEQATENTALPDIDKWDSDVDTVAPKPTSGKQTVSRQMLEMSSPAVDQLIYSDLMSEYNLQVELKVGAAIKAAGPVPAGAFLFATEAAWLGTAPATPGVDAIVRAQVAIRKARKLPANILVTTIDRYGELLLLKDSTGRPLMPEESAGPMNVIGVGTVAVDGRIKGLGVISTEAMGTGAKPDVQAVIRASDTILFESTTMRFRFEEVKGPESIVLGIWGYTAVIVRQGGRSVQRIQVTA